MTIKQLKSNLNSIKNSIGWKNFPEEKNELLLQAFVRRSYSQEHPEWQNNQVLGQNSSFSKTHNFEENSFLISCAL